LYEGWNAGQELSGTTPVANRILGSIDEFYNRTDSTGASSPITDALGTVRALTNSTASITTQYSYDPYGNTTNNGGSSTNVLQYTGRENDGNGLYFYRARYYSPAFGRFISEDPIGFLGGPNKYSYAVNNPVTFRDPFGKSICPIHYQETVIAFSQLGLPLDGAAAGLAVCAEDIGTQGTSVSDTRRHAMAGRKQSCSDAYESTRNFVNTTGDPFAAIHAIQDSYASGHQYQPWPGGLPSFGHLAGDSVYIPAAEAATEQFVNDYLNGNVQDASDYLFFPSCI
jgi:RHS repeat-associated protein